MKRFIWVVLLAIICLKLTGCSGWAVRTSTSRKPRVDQEISGNRGFISGKPTSSPKEPAFTERKVYKIEVEIPQLARKKTAPVKKGSAIRPPKEDKAIWGNEGYISGEPAKESAEKWEMPQAEESPIAKIKEKISQIFEPKPEEVAEIHTYKVRKGDTLQKISRKFYGTTKKWPLLYKANRDKLKGPDKVYPGQVLVIPEVSEYKK
ncbi:MAG: LysM peptidoglycan-binding domain-containing protein [Candidatus Omnitrophica bacterium]|nr:LysM peptidoglycan-binding domain-containing protein [Candidatus Omnitrophota bacterium]